MIQKNIFVLSVGVDAAIHMSNGLWPANREQKEEHWEYFKMCKETKMNNIIFLRFVFTDSV